MDSALLRWHCRALLRTLTTYLCVCPYRLTCTLNYSVVIKIVALYTTVPPHVIAIHRGMLGRVRLYDNESQERL